MTSKFIRYSYFSLLLIVSFLAVTMLSCSGSKSASEGVYKAPGYVKKDYQQIVVYAKIDNDAYRQKLENAMVGVLAKKGYKAIPAYKNFEVSYKYDSVTFMKKIDELKVDGVIAFDYLGHQTSVSDSYRYNGGMYNFFTTGSAPYDLETKSTQTGFMRIDFYNLDARVSQYNTVLPIKLFNGLDPAIKQITEDTYTVLKSDRIL